MARSLTHDPDRLNALRANEKNARWILCRNRDEFPVGGDLALERLAERGGVRPDDYLLDQERDLCVQARDVAALKKPFRRAAIRRAARISHLLAAVMAYAWRLDIQ